LARAASGHFAGLTAVPIFIVIAGVKDWAVEMKFHKTRLAK
jgi:hypothetical protein